MLGVTNKPSMLIVVILDVVMLSVVAPRLMSDLSPFRLQRGGGRGRGQARRHPVAQFQHDGDLVVVDEGGQHGRRYPGVNPIKLFTAVIYKCF
jgi:hypothetical protein